MFSPVGFAAAQHSSADIDWRTKRLQLELLVTAAIDMSLSPADCFHVVDTVVHTLLNIRSRKCSENSSGYMPTVKGWWWWKKCRMSDFIFGRWVNVQTEPIGGGRTLWPLFMFVSSITLSRKQAWSLVSVAKYYFCHHLRESAHSFQTHSATWKACVYQAELALHFRSALGPEPGGGPHRPIHMSPAPSRTSQYELYVFQILKKSVLQLIISLHPESWSFAATGFFFLFVFFPPQLVVALGWTAAYLPNTILERGKTVWCKNLMKATNLCEWLRGITLVRREKNELKMLTFFGGGVGRLALNLCKQSKKFMSDDQSWPLFDHPSPYLIEPDKGHSYGSCT